MCKQRILSGYTMAVGSAPIIGNASMESVVLKTSATSIDNHLKKVEEGNQEIKKKNDLPRSSAYISAREHQLKRVENTSKACVIIQSGRQVHHTKKHN